MRVLVGASGVAQQDKVPNQSPVSIARISVGAGSVLSDMTWYCSVSDRTGHVSFKAEITCYYCTAQERIQRHICVDTTAAVARPRKNTANCDTHHTTLLGTHYLLVPFHVISTVTC